MVDGREGDQRLAGDKTHHQFVLIGGQTYNFLEKFLDIRFINSMYRIICQ